MNHANEPLLRAVGLSKSYAPRQPFYRATQIVRAFQNVELSIDEHAVLAIVGESGAGKSSLGRCLAGLEDPDHGEIWYGGCNLAVPGNRDLLRYRREIQFMFQDSTSALNPRFSAMDLIAEPLIIQHLETPPRARERAIELMGAVGLAHGSASKRPLEFSGGQRQRIALARALALQPKVLILDEALSNLDVALQESILDLLSDLGKNRSITYVHICHDLNLVWRFATVVAVMHCGEIVEQAPVDELFAHPRHPYTQRLLGAMPSLDTLLEERSA